MALLEGLGPKGKIFDELEIGNYTFEIAEPDERGWISEVIDKTNPKAKLASVTWQLRVVSPEHFAGRRFFHRTWCAGTQEKIAMAKKRWEPSSFTFQFIQSIGIAVKDGNDAVVLDDYLDDDGMFLPIKWNKDGELEYSTVGLNKTIGVRFEGELRMEKGQDGVNRIALSKSWPE